MIYQSNFKNLKQLLKLSTIASFSVLISTSSNAYTLNDALISAHEHNYSILAEAENLEASKAVKKQSYTGFLPTVVANMRSTKTKLESPAARSVQTKEKVSTRSITVTQPIFQGGDTYANIKIADSNLEAGKFRFMAVSNNISLQTVSAYEGILNARDIHMLAKNNEKVITENLNLTRTRFKHGEVTKTDVLQAESRLSAAVVRTERALGELRSAEALFERIIGDSLPEQMDEVSMLHVALPGSYEEFLDVSLKNNPSLSIQKYNSEASKYEVNKSYAVLMPKVTAQAQFTRTSLPKDLQSNTSDNNAYTINLEVPIFQSGSEYTEISRKQHLAKKQEYDYKENERTVRENSVRLWNTYKVSQSVIKSSDETIKAQQKVLDGTKEEAKAGTRTTLDVLDAQQELFNAQVTKRTATKDLIEAAYSMLQLMGSLDAIDVINS